MNSLPMPNDKVVGRTVVASAWYTEEPEWVAALLLLNQSWPFWSTALLHVSTGELEIEEDFPGFVAAAIAYADLGLGEALEVN